MIEHVLQILVEIGAALVFCPLAVKHFFAWEFRYGLGFAVGVGGENNWGEFILCVGITNVGESVHIPFVKEKTIPGDYYCSTTSGGLLLRVPLTRKVLNWLYLLETL